MKKYSNSLPSVRVDAQLPETNTGLSAIEELAGLVLRNLSEDERELLTSAFWYPGGTPKHGEFSKFMDLRGFEPLTS